MTQTFRKNERITSRLLLEQLFSGKDSKAVTAFPLKAIYTYTQHHEDDAPVQVLVSVPKRHFKRAVKRNRVKRQVREAYRLNKHLLPAITENEQLLIAFVWLADKLYPSPRVHSQVVKVLNKINDAAGKREG